MSTVRAIVLFFAIPYLIFEIWTRFYLFEHVSYTKSKSLDNTIKDLKSSTTENIYFFGDSEVRWGINPLLFDEHIQKLGLNSTSFNFGIDGFSSGLNLALLKKIKIQNLKSIQVAFIGVQLIEYNQIFSSDEEIIRIVGGGALQRPIFLSAFGIDNGLTELSGKKSSVLDSSPLSVFRYRASIKEMLESRISDARYQPPISIRGFEPHASIATNFDSFKREIEDKLAEKASTPQSYSGLNDTYWAKSLEQGMYFDEYANFFLENNILPVFFALPTNPWLIDIKDRRQNYLRNSESLKKWSADRGLVFIDIGILDHFEKNEDFADFRHLSFKGANKFSELLSKEAAASFTLVNFLKSTDSTKRQIIQQIYSFCPAAESLSGQQLFEAVTIDNDISNIDVASDSLTIHASGTDSRLIFHELSATVNSQIMVNIDISAPEDTTFTMSWTTDKTSSFNNEMTVGARLNKGENRIQLEIKDSAKINKLRIDPGQLMGIYKINSLSYSVPCKQL